MAISREVGQAIVEQGAKQIDGKATYDGCSMACGCGRKAKFKGYRPRFVVTLAGGVRVERAYYHCRHCRTGAMPWDAREGLTGLQWTPGVKSLVGQLLGRLAYAESVELLGLTTGLRMAESCAEQIADELGLSLRAQEAAGRKEMFESDVLPLIAKDVGRTYIAVDGAHAHIDGSWHEVKAGVIYGGEAGDGGIDEATNCHYLATQESAEEFGHRVYAAAALQGVEQSSEQVVIGDGAEWIWNLASHHFPKATQIVDYWHACEHIWNLRRALYPQENARGDRWSREHCRKLGEVGPDSLLRALKRLRPKTVEAGEAVRVEQGYFSGHRERMAYPQFRARGLMIGSGLAEAACKVVVGHRLERAGMRWCRRGADAVLAIRCAVLNREYHRLDSAARAA